MGKMKFRKGVFLIIYRKEKNRIFYLILKRKLHWKGWEFPKGGIETGEKIKDAVKRELKEETGLKGFNIKSYNLKGKYKYDKEYKDRKRIKGQTWRLYSAEVKSKKILLDKLEHSRHKWLEFKKACKKLTWQNQKRCLKLVNNILNQ